MSRVLLVLLFFSFPARAQDGLPDLYRDLWSRLKSLRPTPPPPDGLGRIVSWNVQTLGKKASKAKKDALRFGLGRALIGAGPAVFAAQEVANDKGAATLTRQLPGEGLDWTVSFLDTSAAMNNAIFTSPGVKLNCSGNLMIEGVRHPPHMAHLTVGGADFTVLSVHLSYDKGDASSSAAELKLIMAWVRAQAAKPGADPDFVVAGDFNLPTRAGKVESKRAGERAWEPIEESLGAGFTALVDEPTSRHGREGAANNYDHFLVSDDFLNEEFVVAGAVDTAEVAAAEKQAGGRASDHYPIALSFRHSGAGRDGKPLSLDGAAACK